ncbi:MAG: nicotinate phosphoribosyltransferase [Chloroflexi bacterium]|nr:nicotinate phosphoribosyltransferase [Chloroflexota bacterium]
MKPTEQEINRGILYTDLYELTMAQVYYRMGIHEQQAQFDHFFRSYPDYGVHHAGYCINAGLEWFINWLSGVEIQKHELDYLREQKGRTGVRLFQDDFLDWLSRNFHFDNLSISAIPEGRVVHPNVPLTVVTGSLAIAQILETSLLNHLNFQTLIATKASRIKEAGRGNMVMEFGMRRAQYTGGNAGARAALIGGVDFTSNTGMSYLLGYPPKGTHAHSMVQAFMAMGGTELDAFRAYAEVFPDECLLLIDTINTLESGLPNAIKVFDELRRKGHEPIGVRLDSGDLAYLSVRVARILNEAGYPNAKIILSNELDELVLWQIITQIQEEAPEVGLLADEVINRLIYGVGTRLITSHGDSALDGVYKLVAIQKDGQWKPALKISENPAKIPNPGQKKVWRVYDKRDKAHADLISLQDEDPRGLDTVTLHHPTEYQVFHKLDSEKISHCEPLLEEVMKDGKMLYTPCSIEEIRARREADLEHLDLGVKRILNPHIYHVSLTPRLFQLKQDLIKRWDKS